MSGSSQSMSSNNLAPQPQAPGVSDEIPEELVVLAEKLGMSVSREMGQRRYLNLRCQEDQKPPQGTEVFITKYPRKATEANLLKMCAVVGPVFEFRMMLDFSGTNRGFGFVRYFTREDAEVAIKALDKFEIADGNRIAAAKSIDNCKLRIDNIPHCKSNEEIEAEIRASAAGVVSVDILRRPDDGNSKRYALVKFEDHRDASIARRNFISGRVSLWGQLSNVDWAQTQRLNY